MKHYLLITLFVILLVSCSPDPRKEASAYATTTQADQQAADQAQDRDTRYELDQIRIQNEQAAQAEKQAATARIIRWVSYFILTALCFSITSSGLAYSWAVIGVGRGISESAQLKARLIPLDPRTRQFPLLTYVGKGRYTLANPNADSVMLLDSRNAPDRQMIAAMGYTQAAGAIAQEAALAQDPSGVSMVNPQIVDAHKSGDILTVGTATQVSAALFAKVSEDMVLNCEQ